MNQDFCRNDQRCNGTVLRDTLKVPVHKKTSGANSLAFKLRNNLKPSWTIAVKCLVTSL